MKPFPGKQLISEAKFLHYETCMCHNRLTYKFKKVKSAKEIWVYPDIGNYSFVTGGRLMSSGRLQNLTKNSINEYSTTG